MDITIAFYVGIVTGVALSWVVRSVMRLDREEHQDYEGDVPLFVAHRPQERRI